LRYEVKLILKVFKLAANVEGFGDGLDFLTSSPQLKSIEILMLKLTTKRQIYNVKPEQKLTIDLTMIVFFAARLSPSLC
jgi:hypothetical protein